MGFGRDLEISDDSEQFIQKSLTEVQADIEETPFDPCEVSYHLGWTFHCAGANTSTRFFGRKNPDARRGINRPPSLRRRGRRQGRAEPAYL